MLPPCGGVFSWFLQKGPLRLKSRLNLSMGSLSVLILLMMSWYECFVSIIILVFLYLPFPLILEVRS